MSVVGVGHPDTSTSRNVGEPLLSRKEGTTHMNTYISYAEFFQFCILIVGICQLMYQMNARK